MGVWPYTNTLKVSLNDPIPLNIFRKKWRIAAPRNVASENPIIKNRAKNNTINSGRVPERNSEMRKLTEPVKKESRSRNNNEIIINGTNNITKRYCKALQIPSSDIDSNKSNG